MSGDLNHSQQENLFDPKEARPVTLIGAGAVGSSVAVLLSRMGISRLTVYDGDAVESHNVPMSQYRPRDIGTRKVLALREIVREASGVEIAAVSEFWNGQPLRSDVVCCVDTMEARQALWRSARLNPRVSLFVDTRVASELVSVFAVRPNVPEDQTFYEYYLRYPTAEAVRPSCGTHGVAHVSAFAAATAVSQLTGFWKTGMTKRHFLFLAGDLSAVS